MNDDIEIIPAILQTTEDGFESKVNHLNGYTDLFQGWVQIDIADGIFVKNFTIDVKVIQKYPLNFKKEVHLMVEDPSKYIDDLILSGVQRAVIHIESKNVSQALDRILNSGIRVGLSLNPQTPVALVTPFIDKIDVLQIMSVYPGFQGTKFLSGTLDKIQEAEKLSNNNFRVSVDGGIDDTNIKEIVNAGADNLIIGSYLNENVEEHLEKIWEILYRR